MHVGLGIFFFFKHKTAYDMRISDWSSDLCSSDLHRPTHPSACSLLAKSCRPAGNHDSLDGRARRLRLENAVYPLRALPIERPMGRPRRSEEHTSELQSLMRISYAVFCLKKKNKLLHITNAIQTTISPTTRQQHKI